MSQEEGYVIKQIEAHLRRRQILENGTNFPFDRSEIEKSSCKYVFLVSWVGYETEHTWQTYESFEGNIADYYGRKHNLNLPYDKDLNLDDKYRHKRRELEEIQARVRALDEDTSSRSAAKKKEKRHSDSKNREMKEKKKMESGIMHEVIELDSEDDEEIKKRKKRDVQKMENSKHSSILERSNVKGLKMNKKSEEREFTQHKSKRRVKEEEEKIKKKKKKKESEHRRRQSTDSSDDSDEDYNPKKVEKKKEHSKSNDRGDKSMKRSSTHKRNRETTSDDESDDGIFVSPPKRKRESKEHEKKNERREDRSSSSRGSYEERKRRNHKDRSPMERKKKSMKKYSSDESSDESDGEWEVDKVNNHVKVRDVVDGRPIDGREDLDWKMIRKTMLPFIFQVSFKGMKRGWKYKKSDWLTIEELDNLPALNRYCNNSKLVLPHGYESLMKKKGKSDEDDDIFQS